MNPYKSSIILGAIEEYNKYRSPEINARVVSMAGDTFQIEFRGSFCYTCGFYDYFEDYRILLEEKGLITRILDIKELDEGALVSFQVIG